jgi:Domain of unknown function (DUF4760)
VSWPSAWSVAECCASAVSKSFYSVIGNEGKTLGSQNFWSSIASIATIIGVGVVIYAAFLAVNQLKEMTKARHLEAMLRVYEMIGSEEARSSRRFIYSELKSKPEAITPEERDKIEEVSTMLDRVGSLVSAGLVPADLLFGSHCEMIIVSWERLEPYILYRRRHLDGTYASHFEQLASAARKYQSIH